VACFLKIKNFLNPGDYFVGAGVRWLIKVDDSVLEILFEWPFEWGGSCGDGCVVVGECVHLMIVLE
jgi:hypothetical protein